jgi:hypothetical protein
MKIFSDDTPYLSFVRYCLKHPSKTFPAFYDKPRRIIPNFSRGVEWEHVYIVKMEKLEGISKQEFETISYYLYYGGTDFSSVPKNDVWEGIEEKIQKIEKQYPFMPRFLEDYNAMMVSKIKGSPDIHQDNIMKRKNGEFVLTDPFWEGETPYQTHARLARAEIGYDDNDSVPEKIVGGEKRKVKKKPTHKKTATQSFDDSPF